VLIAVDIDSTLHHYWEQFSAIAHDRFGVQLPYEDQQSWAIPQLRPEQVQWCVAESHREKHVLAAKPYEGAVEIINRWASIGHEIHIASHRAEDSHKITSDWLDQIGLTYSTLHCVDDKIPVCTDLGAALLIDDSPVNLERGLSHGITVATIRHPWNKDFCEIEDVVSAEDWPGLAHALGPRLSVV
jgi:hypothetical protein